MKRKPLIEQLKAYASPFPSEMACRENMLQFIQAHENCFERSLEIGHMTASSWLISQDGSKALLMHHAKLNRWLQLGGHADGDPNLLAVSIKEAQEESGLQAIQAVSPFIFDLDIHLIPESAQQKAHYHYDIRFLLQLQTNSPPQKNHESKELRWITKNPNELPTQEPSILRMFTKWTNL